MVGEVRAVDKTHSMKFLAGFATTLFNFILSAFKSH